MVSVIVVKTMIITVNKHGNMGATEFELRFEPDGISMGDGSKKRRRSCAKQAFG